MPSVASDDQERERRDGDGQTSLQKAAVKLMLDVEEARDELDEHAFLTFIDIVWILVTREAIRVGLDGWRAAA